MTFWDFAHEHPAASLVGLFMIMFTIESVAQIVTKSRKGDA
jgi:hypothetical protein